MNRREFLRNAGGAGSVAALGMLGSRDAATLVGAAESRVTSHESLSRIGVQLYTVRAAMRENLEQTLAQVARVGYKEV